MAELDAARARLEPVGGRMRRYWSGRRVVLTVHTLNGGTRALADELTRAGAVLAALVVHTRPSPGDLSAEHVFCCAERGLTQSRAEFEDWLTGSPPELLAWLDRLDPERSWTPLGSIYAGYAELGGRRAYGHSRAGWTQWDDKTGIDRLWHSVGVPAPDHAVLPVDDPGLADAATALDRGRGVMLAMDAGAGVLTSSLGNRWVRDLGELTAAVAELRGRTSRVRVASFLPGVPCSVMGMVFPDGVAVFDPIEVVTLHRRGTGELLYGGTSTWWRPDPEAREWMRGITQAVGRELYAAQGFVGMFSVDGMLADPPGDGPPFRFAATELNPRHVSGVGLRSGRPDFPLRLLNRALQDGRPEAAGIGWRDVEAVVRDTVRRHPSCSLWIEVPGADALGEGETAGMRYRAQQGGVWVIGPAGSQPPGADRYRGALGPVTGEVGRALGAGDVWGYEDEVVSAFGLPSLTVQPHPQPPRTSDPARPMSTAKASSNSPGASMNP